MTAFLITYDEHHHHDYGALYQLLAGWGAAHLANSVWLVNLNATAEVVRNVVAGKLHRADTLAVLELRQQTQWATLNVKPAANAWLSANMSPSQKAA